MDVVCEEVIVFMSRRSRHTERKGNKMWPRQLKPFLPFQFMQKRNEEEEEDGESPDCSLNQSTDESVSRLGVNLFTFLCGLSEAENRKRAKII